MEITDKELKHISTLANKQMKQEEEVADLERQLSAAKAKLRLTQEVELPNAMLEAGLLNFTLKDGHAISIKDDVRASIPEKNIGKAFAWLRKNNFDGIIKNQVVAEFGKGEDKEAREAMTLLTEHGWSAIQKESIHPQTLKAFLREQLAKGKLSTTTLDLFGAEAFNKAVIK